jgi:hypothetical protein
MNQSAGQEIPQPLCYPKKHYCSVSGFVVVVVARGPIWLRNIITDPHIIAHVNIQCADDMYPKLKIYISSLILDSYEYIAVAYVTTHCMISP